MRSFVHHTLPVEPTLSSSVQEMIVKYQNKNTTSRSYCSLLLHRAAPFVLSLMWPGTLKKGKALNTRKAGKLCKPLTQ